MYMHGGPFFGGGRGGGPGGVGRQKVADYFHTCGLRLKSQGVNTMAAG